MKIWNWFYRENIHMVINLLTFQTKNEKLFVHDSSQIQKILQSKQGSIDIGGVIKILKNLSKIQKISFHL